MDLKALEANYTPVDVKSLNAHYQQPQQQQKKGGLFGTLENFLPAIGGVVGAVGGSLFAPGIGTAGGGAAGSGLGELIKEKLQGTKVDPKEIALQGALGTVGGLGKGLGAIKGASSALKAGEGLGDAASMLRYGAKGAPAIADIANPTQKVLQASAANAGQRAIPAQISRVSGQASQQALLSQAPGLSKRTAESAIRDVSGMKDLGYSSIGKMAEHAPHVTGENGLLTQARNELVNDAAAKNIDTGNFMQTVKDHLDNNVDLTTTQKKNITQLMEGVLNKHNLAGGTEGIGISKASDFNNAMKDVFNSAYTAAADSPARKTLLAIGNDMRPAIKESLSNVPFTADMKNGIINELRARGVSKPQLIQGIRKATTAGDLANIESKYVTASNVAKDSAENALRAGINMGTKPGLTQELNQAAGEVIGKPVKMAVSGATGVLSKIAGKGGQKEAATTIPGLAGQTARQVTTAQLPVRGIEAINQAGTPDQSQSQQATDQTPIDINQPTDQTPTDQGPFSQDAIQRAIVADIATTGGKNISKLESLYTAFKPPAPSATQQQATDQIKGALGTLNEYYNQLQSAGGGQGVAVGPAQSILGRFGLGGQKAAEARALEQTRVDVATTLARAMTGNSRPAQQQVQQWLASIPNITDPQNVAEQKIKNITGLVNARLGATQ